MINYINGRTLSWTLSNPIFSHRRHIEEHVSMYMHQQLYCFLLCKFHSLGCRIISGITGRYFHAWKGNVAIKSRKIKAMHKLNVQTTLCTLLSLCNSRASISRYPSTKSSSMASWMTAAATSFVISRILFACSIFRKQMVVRRKANISFYVDIRFLQLKLKK